MPLPFDLPQIGREITALITIVVTIMVGKFIIGAATARISGYRGRTVPLVGVGMIQIGEASLVLAELGFRVGAISSRLYSLTL